MPTAVQTVYNGDHAVQKQKITTSQKAEEIPFKPSMKKDKEIMKLLMTKGYNKITKLITTDQGSVWRAISSLGKSVVIKIASKLHYDFEDEKCEKSSQENILKEIELLQTLNAALIEESDDLRACITEIIEVMDDEHTNNFLLVLEDGGIDLFKFTKQCHKEIAEGKMTISEWKKTVRLMAKRLINIIHWMHNKLSLCHLDISLENCLISEIKWISYPDHNGKIKKRLSPEFVLKVIDFGAAHQFDADGGSFQCMKIAGKPSYSSPAIFRLQNKLNHKSYDARASDLWSFAVSLFILSVGCPPWVEPNERDARFQQIVMYQNLDLLLNAWKREHFMDKQLKNLLNQIFLMKEEDRISTNNALKHSWFR